MAQGKSKKIECRSFEEYKKKFFPSESKQKLIDKGDPHSIGTYLANESLHKFRRLKILA